MKDFYGNEIMKYYETEKKGRLSNTYGSGQVKTDSLDLTRGTYILSVSCHSEQSVGNKLSAGIFQGRIHKTDDTILVDGSHAGDGGYDLSFTRMGIVNLEKDTSIYALGQTASTNCVGGGMRVVLRAVKVI